MIDLLERRATELNEWSDRLIRPHLQTPTPMSFNDAFVPAPFELPRPEKPDPEEVSLISSWFGGRERADARYQEELASYRVAISQWRAAEENHGTDQEAARKRHERWRDGDAIAAQELLEDRLGGISWPRETLISYQTTGTDLRVDVDLPELEDMPADTARVLKREMRVEMRPKGATERRLDYVTHVHSIAFRIAGEAFAAMPSLRNVLISGFSVTDRLLPRWLSLDARDEFFVIDKGIEEFVPGFGGNTGISEHVGQFLDAVVGQCCDGLVRTGIDADD
ncbi:hypothetical protein [Nioella nitratireducens]|uniref:hypothetical protein n=1 Tax=Nioella nitratireducens TaxID=1287720 RepID=UPI001F308407|nr:hypothetical protein [Nioella nitratireducens]